MAEPPEPAPVAAWDFDQIEGRLVLDSSGECNHLVVHEGTLEKGVDGYGLACDGEESAAFAPHTATLNPTKAITVEVWVKLRRLPESGHFPIVRKDGAYALRFMGPTLAMIVWQDASPVYLNAAKTDWQLNRWYHLAATYDGSAMRLFIDGCEDARSPRAQEGPIDRAQTRCGVGYESGALRLDGVVDDVRIYHQAVEPAAIAAAHAAGRRSLEKQAGATLEPKALGRQWPVLRKPTRPIRMVVDGFLWIDAEDFADYGGWWLDTQFVHLMGSGYLIAAGVDRPVPDASIEIEVPESGRYRLWVRAKDWLPEYSPGRFRVLVDGRPIGPVFGKADTDRWQWLSAGEVDLKAGTHRLALRDLTGYYSRCDAFVLTTDLDYTPPDELEALRQERSRLTGLSLEPQPAGEYDVVVVGAGAAGCCTALAAARTGAKTVLIQNRPVLGGNSSIELGVPINGAGSLHRNARESGIIEEAGRIRARYGFPKMSGPFERLAGKEPNLTVLLNRHVFDVDMRDDKRIAAVKAVDTLLGSVSSCRGKMFIDCTGDGWVGFLAGARYRVGRESRGQHNESLAPEEADGITMSGCLMGRRALSYRAVDAGEPSPYTPPPWAAKLPPAEEFGRRPRGFISGQWWLEHRGDIDDIYDAEKARDALIRITYGYWNYIKNEWPEHKRAENYKLDYVPITDAKRESRRLIGDYILTQNDTQQGRIFPDRVSYGGWPLDVHHPEGIFSGREGPFWCNDRVPIYTIPFRSLYSVNVDNLMFAGRNMSVTHIALGTVRVQGTLAAMGQVVGTAAALCVSGDLTPRKLCFHQIEEFQQRLVKDDLYIPEVKNDDPDDLARSAKVAASSTARFQRFERGDVQPDEAHEMHTSRAMMMPRGAQTHWKSVYLLLSSACKEPVEMTLHLRQADREQDFTSTDDLATATAVVPPGRRSWVEFRVDCDIEEPYVWVWLPATEGVSWYLMRQAPLGACRAWGGTAGTRPWTTMPRESYAMYAEPPIALPIDCPPEAVINGVTRVIDRTLNLWASDPDESLPQWIELAFGQPAAVNTVYLTFDTDMNAPFHTAALVPECVRDYRLSYHDGSDWCELAHVKGNFQRRRVHRFDTVEAAKLRLTIEATNGSDQARVFEMRAYRE